MTEQQACKDLPSTFLLDGDKLTHMLNSQFELQHLLSASFGHIVELPTSEDSAVTDGTQLTHHDSRAEQLMYNILASHAELTELLEFIPWKNWKTYPEPFSHDDVMEARYEAIDILHFVFNIMMLLGMNAQMIYDGFMRKQEENRNRQKRGY